MQKRKLTSQKPNQKKVKRDLVDIVLRQNYFLKTTFEHLDYQSIYTCRMVCRTWKNFAEITEVYRHSIYSRYNFNLISPCRARKLEDFCKDVIISIQSNDDVLNGDQEDNRSGLLKRATDLLWGRLSSSKREVAEFHKAASGKIPLHAVWLQMPDGSKKLIQSESKDNIIFMCDILQQYVSECDAIKFTYLRTLQDDIPLYQQTYVNW